MGGRVMVNLAVNTETAGGLLHRLEAVAKRLPEAKALEVVDAFNDIFTPFTAIVSMTDRSTVDVVVAPGRELVALVEKLEARND